MTLPDRRSFLVAGAASAASLAVARLASSAPAQQRGPDPAADPVDKSKPTKFQIACMTLPYSAFPLERALTGIKDAGYKFVAWGTAHKEEGGKQVPVMPADAPPEKAKELAKRCRDLGLEPLMMF